RDNLSNYVYYAEHCKHYYNANGIECFPLDSKNEMRTCHITQPVLIGNPRKEETDREYVDVYPGMLDFATALQAAIRTNNYEFFAH
ncbi:MAG: hypothetical protein FWC51_04850, partial [Proteobacteria bacterium]|nr:hypothetical protein [Pseudomonadota bacterium]